MNYNECYQFRIFLTNYIHRISNKLQNTKIGWDRENKKNFGVELFDFA